MGLNRLLPMLVQQAGEGFLALAPLAILFAFFQVFLLKLPTKALRRILTGLVLAYVGLVLFLTGVNFGFAPLAQALGESLVHRSWLIPPVGFVVGFISTIAEPAVRILATQIDQSTSGNIRSGLILWSLSLGVGLLVSLGFTALLFQWPLMAIILPGYGLALILTLTSSQAFVPIAYDAGGTATGPMNVTFVLAIGVGIVQGLAAPGETANGFGLISLIALAPILALLVLGTIMNHVERRQNGTQR